MSETLGASFSIDVTNLKAGLAQANRLIRQSESEFRSAAAGMDDWSNSEEGLISRQKSLTKQIEIQKAKIEALTKEKERVIAKMKEEGKSQEEIDQAIDKTNKQIEKEGRQLDRLQSELNRTESSLDDMGESTLGVASAMEKAEGGFTVIKGALANLVADGFRKAIDAAKEFATSMITVSAEVKASNSQFTQTFGDLESDASNAIKGIANKTGILDTRLRNTGAGIYAFARSSGASTKDAMKLMQDALMATADSAAYYDKSLEESAETLQSFLKGNFANDAALGVSATEFTRNAKATELFGKKYAELSEIEKQKTLLKMVTDSQKLSGAMGQAARESDGFENVMGNVNETMKQFKAKVGTPVLEALIPVIQDATSEFQEFADGVDWNAYGKKATTALKNIITKGKELGKSILPTIKAGFKVVGDATKFVIDNFSTFAKTTATAVVAYKSFSAVMKTTTAITAAKTAIAGLTTGVGLATKAQAVWNATMSANPIGAVITAVGLLAGGIAILIKKQKEANEADLEEIRNKDLLSESQRALVTATEEATQAYKENKQASMEGASADLANIDYTQRLWQELQTLADANGTVKAGYEGRAQYILGELNNALGTEYTLNDGIITQYGDMKTAIESLIETKKAEVMLSAYEEQYKQAIQNVADAELSRATQAQELSLQRQELSNAETAVIVANEEYEKKSAEAKTEAQFNALAQDTAHLNELIANRDAEQAKLDELQGKYNETSGALSTYYADISTYENASAELLQGNTAKAIEILSQRGEGFKTAASTVQLGADEQKKVLEQQVIDTEINAQLMEQAYNDGVEGVTEEMVKTAREQADSAKREFKSIGGNITQGIAEGASANSWILNGAMNRIINDALAAAKKAADSHSPSRLFKKKVGITIPQGIAVGVDEGTPSVLKSVKKQISAIKNAYNFNGISDSVNAGISSNVTNASGNGQNKGGGGVVVYQTNNYSQAHSRYELYKSKQQTAAAVRLAMVEG